MGYIEELRAKIGHMRVILPGAVVVIRDGAGRLLVQQRVHPPGKWSFPGGLMELGESAEETARREVFEETGLTVGSLRLIGVYSGEGYLCSAANGDEWYVVTIAYAAEEYSGALTVDRRESVSFEWISPGALPEGFVRSHREILGDYLEMRGGQMESDKLKKGLRVFIYAAASGILVTAAALYCAFSMRGRAGSVFASFLFLAAVLFLMSAAGKKAGPRSRPRFYIFSLLCNSAAAGLNAGTLFTAFEIEPERADFLAGFFIYVLISLLFYLLSAYFSSPVRAAVASLSSACALSLASAVLWFTLGDTFFLFFLSMALWAGFMSVAYLLADTPGRSPAASAAGAGFNLAFFAAVAALNFAGADSVMDCAALKFKKKPPSGR